MPKPELGRLRPGRGAVHSPGQWGLGSDGTRPPGVSFHQKGTGNRVVRLNVPYLFKKPCHFYTDYLPSLPPIQNCSSPRGMSRTRPWPLPPSPAPSPAPSSGKALCIINLEHIHFNSGDIGKIMVSSTYKLRF